jgi:hypothetical protein
MKPLSYLIVIALCCAAGCGASINPAYKADVDRRIAALHPSSASYPAGDSFEPMPLAVGQWIELKMVDDQQQPSLLTYKVVGQEGDAFWFEVTTESYKVKSETRMLVNLGDRTNPETFAVKAFTVRTNGQVNEYPPSLLGMLKGMWKPLVKGLQVQWKDLPREDVKVVAGEFAGAFKRRSTASYGPYEQTSDGWAHPAVPINGLVRGVGTDKPYSIELIAFGTEGATSTF